MIKVLKERLNAARITMEELRKLPIVVLTSESYDDGGKSYDEVTIKNGVEIHRGYFGGHRGYGIPPTRYEHSKKVTLPDTYIGIRERWDDWPGGCREHHRAVIVVEGKEYLLYDWWYENSINAPICCQGCEFSHLPDDECMAARKKSSLQPCEEMQNDIEGEIFRYLKLEKKEVHM